MSKRGRPEYLADMREAITDPGAEVKSTSGCTNERRERAYAHAIAFNHRKDT